MKRIFSIILSLIGISMIFASCEDKYTEEYYELQPVYLSYADFRQSVKITSGHDLEKPGKIYNWNQWIFINELTEGIHIYDNSNPISPQYKGFITIPGNVDIAIQNNIMYADSYIDLVAIDLSDMSNIKEVGRAKSVFTYSVPAYESGYRLGKIDDTQGVVVDWTVKKVRKETEHIDYPVYPLYYAEKFSDFASLNAAANGTSSAAAVSGVGGSMARFGLTGNNLLSVDNSSYYCFDLSNPSTPTLKYKNYIGWNVETMFLYGARMFLGTSTGMLVYDITNTSSPTYISNFWHITGCDPVVVQNNKAYVTIRGGNICGGTTNRLDVLDITNISSIGLIRSYNMESPYGLGIDDELLFLCDGKAGLKIYTISDPYLIAENMIAKFSDIHAYDAIPLGSSLLLIGDDGFYQYDYTNLTNIKQISAIKVK